jgi:predicted PurR-regulated permease PerM
MVTIIGISAGAYGAAPGFARRRAGATRSTMKPERVVLLRPRTVLSVAAVLLGVAMALWIVWVSRRVLTWVFVALFLALALNPAVHFLQQRGLRRRGAAAAVIYITAILVVAALAALFVPPLVDQATDLGKAAPGYVEDITAGRGPLGFLESDYHLVDKVQKAVDKNGGNFLGSAGTVVDVGRGVVTGIVGFITILFLTLFMILEGPAWLERGIGLMPAEQRPRWRNVGQRIAATVSGYVTGNLLLSVIAGFASTIALLILGVPFALALGLVVAVLDLIPLAGATLAGILLGAVGFLTSVTAGIVMVIFFVLYQQLENHVLQPLVYGRTVQLSPLVVLIAILIGTEVAGILGALAAIPVAGTLQILLQDWLEHRRMNEEEGGPAAVAAETVEPMDTPPPATA